jgi:hypothetical protein
VSCFHVRYRASVGRRVIRECAKQVDGSLVTRAAWDLWRRRRIHPAVLFGAALLWTGEIIVTVLNFSPAWRQAMVRLVDAWGYSG